MSHAVPTFDLRSVPFSRRGSWLDLSPVIAAHRTVDDVHVVSHRTGMHAVLALTPSRTAASGRISSEWTTDADAARLRWSDGHAGVDAVFAEVDVVRIRGSAGTRLEIAEVAGELTPFTGMYLFRDPRDGSAVFTAYETGARYRVTALEGALRLEGAEALGAARRSVIVEASEGLGEWEIALEELESSRSPYRRTEDFDEAVAKVRTEFVDFAAGVAPWTEDDELSPEDRDTAMLAAYVIWSATVAPAGFLERESVLMSKHWMDKVWSWDHCFNAIALVRGDPRLALDQFLAPFDHQDAAGALPDSIAHSERLYNFVKPPIHGWALDRLRRDGLELRRDEREVVYDKLSRWTRFWLDERRVPGRALPYYQHGNDSGWDNSTAFDRARLIESPDLAAFLLLQLDTLSRLADELGLDGSGWRTEGERIAAALDTELWRGDGYSARGVADGADASRSTLLTSLAIAAGPLLPEEARDALAEGLTPFLTPWGLATERPDSGHYESDGYWRGPIWAPSTMLIEDGLRRSGHVGMADDISERFRGLCRQHGFAENFDALTGDGLRDRAYTWTAAVYLTLAGDAARRAREPA